MKNWMTGLRVAVVTLILTGGVYPLVVTGLAQGLFPGLAQGSLVKDLKGRVVGSALIGQGNARAEYFQGRASAAGDKGYDGLSSGGSNLGTTSKKLKERVEADVVKWEAQNKGAEGSVPQELVTASASGLDPQISPAAALWQAPRVAAARGVGVERVKAVVEANVEGRELGFLGEPRVNVLQLNLAMDRQFGTQNRPEGE